MEHKTTSSMLRKPFWNSSFTLIAFLSFLFVPSVSLAQITVTLRVGDRGPQVLSLQKLLNLSPDTIIAVSGVGSPGNETDYFGSLTRLAVIKFQEKYREDILTPSGLLNGTGVVGPKTLQKLNILANLPQKGAPVTLVIPNATTTEVLPLSPPKTATPRPYLPSGNSIVPQIAPTAGFSATNAPTNTSNSPAEPALNPGTLSDKPVTEYGSYASLPKADQSNPNFENYDTFLSAVRKLSREKGKTNVEIAQMEEVIYQSVATTTNLKELFVKSGAVKVSNANHKTSSENSGWFHGFFYNTINKLAEALYPKEVQAASCSSGMPFGGRILFTMICTCSGAWLTLTMPTAPTYVALLTHYIGRQSYAYYSSPFAMNWLGCYTPGAQECQMVVGYFCISIPSQGATTAFLGSR